MVNTNIISTYMDCPTPYLQADVSVIKKMCKQRFGLYSILPSLNLLDTLEEIKGKLDPRSCFVELFQDDARHIRNSAIYIDQVSHFVLRHCYATRYTRYFVDYEAKWLQIRFQHALAADKQRFIKANSKQYSKDCNGLYRMPFERALYLIANRLCEVNLGEVSVAEDDLVHVVCQEFKLRLLRHLQDEVKPNLKNLPPVFKTMLDSLTPVILCTYATKRQLKFENLDYASKFFPLCMKNQYEHLKEHHHVGHYTRFELGVFLKAIGLSLEDTIRLFEEEFKDRWTKKLTYYFKHLYGVAGNKFSYDAESCQTIINKPTSSSQLNGCPFSKWRTDTLIQRFQNEGFDRIEIDDILASIAKENVQEACAKYAGRCAAAPTLHPVDYFNSSSESKIPDIEDIFLF